MCLWVMNHQFINHKCAGESQDDLRGREVFFFGTRERQMCRAGLQSEWRSFFKSGQVDKGNDGGLRGRRWADLSATCDGIWHPIRRKGQGQRQTAMSGGLNRVCEKFHNRGKGGIGSETRHRKGIKALIRVGFLKVSFSADWTEIGFVLSWDAKTPLKVQKQDVGWQDVNSKVNKTKKSRHKTQK